MKAVVIFNGKDNMLIVGSTYDEIYTIAYFLDADGVVIIDNSGEWQQFTKKEIEYHVFD